MCLQSLLLLVLLGHISVLVCTLLFHSTALKEDFYPFSIYMRACHRPYHYRHCTANSIHSSRLFFDICIQPSEAHLLFVKDLPFFILSSFYFTLCFIVESRLNLGSLIVGMIGCSTEVLKANILQLIIPFVQFDPLTTQPKRLLRP